MDIREYLAIMKRRWVLIVGAGALGLVAAAITTALIQPTYSATARLFITTASGSSVSDAYQGNLFSQDRVHSYAEIATGRQVAQKTVEQLGLPIGADTLRTMITAEAQTDSVVLDITASTENAEMSRDVANVVAAQTSATIKELETSARGGLPTASATVLDAAEAPESPSSPSWPRNLIIGLLGGLVVGFVGAIIRDKTDSRVRSGSSLAETAGAPLLGSVADPSNPEDSAADFQTIAQRLVMSAHDIQTAVVVTSASNDDVATAREVVLGVANALAESGESVVVVETGQAEPALALLADSAATPGLTEVLARRADLAKAYSATTPAGAHILPVGDAAGQVRGAYLASADMTEVLKELEVRFRWVLLTGAPVLSEPDVVAMRSAADTVLLVARIAATDNRDLDQTVERLTGLGLTTAGVVAAGSEPRWWM